jgi:hypothetical protein
VSLHEVTDIFNKSKEKIPGKGALARRILWGAVLALATVGAFTHLPWLLDRTLWQSFGFSVAPASAYYQLSIENRTDWALTVRCEVVNDREFGATSAWEVFCTRMAGHAQEAVFIIAPGESRNIILPSGEYASIGMLLLTTYTQVESPGTAAANQRVAIYLLSWFEASSQGISEKGGPTVPVLKLKPEDFLLIDKHVDSPANAIEIVRRSPENLRIDSNWQSMREEDETH